MITEQEKKGIATAGGVVAGVAVGGSAAYAATQAGHEDDATVEPEVAKSEPVAEVHTTNIHNTVVSEVEVVVENEPPADTTATVEVLSYDTFEYEGHLMDAADVQVDGTLHRYVDVDRDGFADIEGVDVNHDAQFSEDEIRDLEPRSVSMHEFQEAYTTPGGGDNDEFLALNDEGPDYVDDISFDASGADVMV